MNQGQRAKRPFVRVNVAMTADGKIATANRAVSSFSSRRDREHMMELRAGADAVMCGARTADLNPIHLGPGAAKYRALRKKRGLAEYNLRIVVSGSGSLNPDAALLKKKFSPVIVLTTQRAKRAQIKRLESAGAIVRICGTKEIDWLETLHWLRQEWKVKNLLCEGGGEINDALFRAGAVDELHVTICSKIFGGRNAPTLSDGVGAATLAEATQLELRSSRKIGQELFLVYRAVAGK